MNEKSTHGREYTYIASSQSGFQPPKRKHDRQRKLQILQSPQSKDLSQRSLPALGNRPFDFSMLDMELFHHYMSSTAPSLGDDEKARQLLQIQLPRLGFSFHYVLHLLLALSGFHLARIPSGDLQQSHEHRQSYLERAQWHYTTALGQVVQSVTRLNSTTFSALYAASSFMCFCTLARAPQPGDYLLFSTRGQVELLTLLHGVRSILETRTQASTSKDTASDPTHDFKNRIPTTARFANPLDQIQHLIYNESEQSNIRSATYWKVYDDLVSTFQSVRSESRPKGEQFASIFGWLYRLPHDYIVDIQERQPVALILFAFFAVLLKDISGYWFIDGWPKHIMTGIHENLDETYRSWICWPIAAIE